MLWQLARSEIIGFSAEQQRSEDQRAERTGYSNEWLTLRLNDSERGGWFSLVLFTCSHGCWPHRESAACFVQRSSCRSIMLRQEELASLRLSHHATFPGHSRGAEEGGLVERSQRCLLGAAAPQPDVGPQPPQRSSAQLKGKRKDNELESSGGSLEPVNQRLAMGPGLCPRE